MADADAFHLAALAKVPLADAALRLLDSVLDADGLARVFDEHRGAAYDRKITFATLVRSSPTAWSAIAGRRPTAASRPSARKMPTPPACRPLTAS